jgi:nucleoside-diphosphate-sugar epimerase
MKRILVTGCFGQIGSDLINILYSKYGKQNVIATGVRTRPPVDEELYGPIRFLDILIVEKLKELVFEYNIDTIYQMGTILSAVGEQNPQLAYEVNMQGLYNVLEVARKYKLERVIWPSSIAVFGPETPRVNTPNETIMRPTTMYGVTKVAGELLAEYYWRKYKVDTRSVRLPGIISYKSLPGGGTTDYSVEMYYDAILKGHYTCFVREDTVLPLMYMPDAVKGLIDLAEADGTKLIHRTFNLGSMSFSAGELAQSIKEILPDFTVDYKPDYRQEIADSWPQSLDDSAARKEWNWKPNFDLPAMTKDMIKNLREKLKK